MHDDPTVIFDVTHTNMFSKIIIFASVSEFCFVVYKQMCNNTKSTLSAIVYLKIIVKKNMHPIVNEHVTPKWLLIIIIKSHFIEVKVELGTWTVLLSGIVYDLYSTQSSVQLSG